MLTLTRKVDYGLIAVAHLCMQEGELASARHIARHYGISERLVSNILKELARAGIVRSVRGAKGGYRIAMAPEAITARMVFEALQGPFRFAVCTGEESPDGGDCTTWSCCPVKHAVGFMHERIQTLLDEITFDELLTADLSTHAAATVTDDDGRMQV